MTRIRCSVVFAGVTETQLQEHIVNNNFRRIDGKIIKVSEVQYVGDNMYSTNR